MTITWWNTSYSIRKQLNIDVTDKASIAIGDPLYVVLDSAKLLSLNKIRGDFEDVEIVYWDYNAASPSWTLLARDIEYNSQLQTFSIAFNAVNDIATTDSGYYMHYCNASLNTQPTRPTYSAATYSTVATPQNGGIMFTKPLEDWDDGVSRYQNARAAFSFYGKRAKLIFQGRSDGGIVELNANFTTSTFQDTYSNSQEEITMTYDFDAIEKVTLRMRVTGDKNPTSNGSVIELKRVEYSRYIESEIFPEEIYSSSNGIKTTIGP